MARSCTICLNPQREVIDRALIEGKPYRDIARHHATSKDALMRHHKAHLSPTLTRVAQRREERGAETALNRLEHLYEKADRVLDAAEEAGSTGIQLAAIRELRGIVETLAKVTGELRPESSGVTVNILQSPEIQRYIVVIREVLADQPDRLALIAQRLELPA
jgi:hypothetical protein